MTSKTAAIRILVIDDHEVVREGLRMLISSTTGFEIVGETGNPVEALSLCEREQPEIVLLDLDLGDESGLDILPELLSRAKECRVLVLTGVRDPEVHHRVMMLGAMGVVQKEKAYRVLLKAIQKVHEGEIWYDRSKMGDVIAGILRNGKDATPDFEETKIASLTPREHEVITLISLGMKNRAIGEKLFISETTVRHHLTSIFEKLCVSSRLELIIYAFSHGLAALPAKGGSTTNGFHFHSSNLQV